MSSNLIESQTNIGNMSSIAPFIPVFKPEHQMDLRKLSSEQMSEVRKIESTVSFDDTNTLLSFAIEPQKALNLHLDELLQGIRTYEAGVAGEIISALTSTIDDLKLDEVKQELKQDSAQGFSLKGLPVVGKYFSALQHLKANYTKITAHLDTIEAKANQKLTTLNAINSKYDRLVEVSINHMMGIELYLAAAQILIIKGRNEFEKRRQAAEGSRDLIEISKLRDFSERLNAFETRVVRMHLAYTQSMVSIPEIRTAQSAGTIEQNNIIDSILFDLPRLKRAIVALVGLKNISDADKDTQARKEFARKMDALESDELQTVYLNAKASQGDFNNDILLLAQSADKLLQTIELGRKMDIENSKKRDKAISDISEIKKKFADGILFAQQQFIEKAVA